MSTFLYKVSSHRLPSKNIHRGRDDIRRVRFKLSKLGRVNLVKSQAAGNEVSDGGLGVSTSGHSVNASNPITSTTKPLAREVPTSAPLKKTLNPRSSLVTEQVEQLVEEAAAFISCILNLRVVDPYQFNPAYEIWTRIASIPPEHRWRVLSELDPGSIRSLWKASMSRYRLDPERSLELFGSGFTVFDDFPEQAGEVFTFDGACESFAAWDPLAAARPPSRSTPPPAPAPLLRPGKVALGLPGTRFSMHFFRHPASGALHCRVSLPFLGPLSRWWSPCYALTEVDLVLTPLSVDAGADMVLNYEPSASPLPLTAADLPLKSWPPPREDCISPFSHGPVDYVRAAGPGVYVGCAYLNEEGLPPAEENTVYFVFIRKY